MDNSFIATLFVVVPLSTAFFISLLARFVKRGFLYALSVFSAGLILLTSFYALSVLPKAANNILVYKIAGLAPPFGICLVLDGLSVFMLVVVNLTAFFVSIYNIDYIDKHDDAPKFLTLFFMMLAGLNGVVITGDLFNLFVFLEVASIAGYALVCFRGGAEELEAAFKYAVMGSTGSAFIFIGIAFLYSFTSTLNMADMSRIISMKEGIFVVPFVTVLFIMGFGLKAALAPFHAWLPDAHTSAPASISAMFSGVLIKALGVYTLARILFNVLGTTQILLSALMVLGAISILASGVLAVSQWNMKRLFAYSSIGQVGYIFLGLGLGTPWGIFGAIFHIFQHSAAKSLLFLTAGSVDKAVHTQDLREMSGLREKMPVTAGGSLAASMSLSGIPPLGAFFSKLIIILACIQKGLYFYAFIAVIGSILTLSAMAKIQRFAFFGGLKDKFKNIKEAPFAMRISIVCLAGICVFGGLLLLPQFRPFIGNAAQVLLEGAKYSGLVLGAAVK